MKTIIHNDIRCGGVMKLTAACMICNRMVPAGEFCPHCVTQVDLNEAEKQSSVKREIIGSLNRKRRPVWTDPREWKGLTDKEIYNIDFEKHSFYEAAKIIEEILRMRNT
jgi:hypothetical protein